MIRGSAHDESAKQAQAMMHEWTHVNSRTFALEYIMRDLAIFSGAALVAVVLMQQRVHPAKGRG